MILYGLSAQKQHPQLILTVQLLILCTSHITHLCHGINHVVSSLHSNCFFNCGVKQTQCCFWWMRRNSSHRWSSPLDNRYTHTLCFSVWSDIYLDICGKTVSWEEINPFSGYVFRFLVMFEGAHWVKCVWYKSLFLSEKCDLELFTSLYNQQEGRLVCISYFYYI